MPQWGLRGPHRDHCAPQPSCNRRSNRDVEQSSIVLLPVALTSKVGREDSQAVPFPHPEPRGWKSSQAIRMLREGGQKVSLSLFRGHTERRISLRFH